mgnify:CR=1 FL=1
MVTVWRFKSPSPSKMFINLILCWQDMSCFDLKQMSRDFSPHAGYGATIFSFDLIIINYRYGIEQSLLNIYKTSKNGQASNRNTGLSNKQNPLTSDVSLCHSSQFLCPQYCYEEKKQ